MISLSVTVDAADVNHFLVKVEGEIKRPKALNDALGRRLARELQGHFRARNAEPNNMAAPKTNFWNQISDATAMTEATDIGATVTIAESRFRIQLFGGTIKPTGGRKWLTIPLIKEARGLRVSEYEAKTGHKLFRLPGTRVLVERSEDGNRSLIAGEKISLRRNGGNFRKVNIRARSKIRTVYALATEAHIQKDPRALPPQDKLITALTETGNAWLARNLS